MTTRQLGRLMRPLMKLIIQHPKSLLAIILAGGIWYGYEVGVARPAMSYMGLPQAVSAPAANSWSHTLRNQAFMLGYSEKLANPLWVTYQVTAKRFDSGKRPSRFSADWRSPSYVSHEDYTRSGFDRGHMAPNYVIASRYGRSAQLDTFLMTNITPQKPNLNQKSWQRLEEVIANDFSEWYGDFWVVTGPVFATEPKTLKNSRVAIPDAFYKILIKPGSAEQPAKALAFVFPQTAKPNASLMQFVTTIDEVERQTGLDFFHQLEDDFENRLESSLTPQAWKLETVANRPSRY
ncbi:MAG: DNA/RNA non-specific endonuclease [Thiomicrorhabdus chilensis]|uniref:DNA/RNA non-specific endonuclease n=1 Tax=Thiomicrorhabdus chilensis TaxID=63656 RepID=UPI00299CF358|nr:DNA/RNA non-specific endonuclease [Thiomicrorhabdus chilensis]MDX1348086.1 DNA/RNA non-specific endonuclease [Thiomicrorhabdus chilensis]